MDPGTFPGPFATPRNCKMRPRTPTNPEKQSARPRSSQGPGPARALACSSDFLQKPISAAIAAFTVFKWKSLAWGLWP